MTTWHDMWDGVRKDPACLHLLGVVFARPGQPDVSPLAPSGPSRFGAREDAANGGGDLPRGSFNPQPMGRLIPIGGRVETRKSTAAGGPILEGSEGHRPQEEHTDDRF